MVYFTEGVSNLAYHAKAQERLSQGKCPLCGGVTGGKVTCSGCRIKNKRTYQKRYATLRGLIFDHYGRCCDCCGESEPVFLAIDHMPGASREGDQRNLTEWIVKNGFPEGFRILCHNCNMAIRFKRICPHQEAT